MRLKIEKPNSDNFCKVIIEDQKGYVLCSFMAGPTRISNLANEFGKAVEYLGEHGYYDNNDNSIVTGAYTNNFKYTR